MVQVKHRRNHAVAGLGLVLSSILIGMGATQSMVKISGPSIGIDLSKNLGLTLQSSGGFGSDGQTTAVLLGCAALTASCGLLLLVTRIRYLGLLWRLGGLVGVAYPAVLAYWFWQLIHDPTATLKAADRPWFEQATGGIADWVRGALWDVTPTMGLYFLTAGVVCGVLGLLVPATRRETPVWTEQIPGWRTPPPTQYGSYS